MERLRWILEFIDRMSGPARRAGRATEELASKLDKASGAAGRSTRGMRAQAAVNKGIAANAGEIFKTYVALKAANVAAQALSGTMGAFAEGGVWAVKTLAFKESVMASFEAMLGSRRAADEMFSQALGIARRTPFEATDVVEGFKSLLSAGVKAKDLERTFTALGDVAAAAGFDKTIIERMSLQMAQMRGIGKLQMVDLRVMSSMLGQAGIGLTDVYGEIARRMGIKTEEVAKAMEAGQVSADIGMAALLGAIEGRAGGMMARQSRTITGLLSQVASLPGELMMSFGKSLEEMEGVQAFKNTLTGIIKALDVTKGFGARVLDDLARLVDSGLKRVFGDYGASKQGQKRLEVIFDTLLRFGKGLFTVFLGVGELIKGAFAEAIPGMRAFGDAFDPDNAEAFYAQMRRIGGILGSVVSLFLRLAAAGVRAADAIGKAREQVVAYLRIGQALGNAMGNGIVGGLLGMGANIMQAGSDIGTDARMGLQDELEIQSPSRVFHRLGEQTTAGFEEGMRSGVTGEGVGAIAAQRPATSGASVAMGGVTVNVSVDARGREDTDAVVDRLVRLIPEAISTQLAGMFERMAMEGGTA